MSGQNHIIAKTPLKLLPVTEFRKRQKSIDRGSKLALMSSMMKIKADVIEKKTKAKWMKERGNDAFQEKKYQEAEKWYSKGIELNKNSRPLWTNRAICRNRMKKYKEAISDCDSALSINPKCTKSITQKGSALLGFGRFDDAKAIFESLRTLGENTLADTYLKKLNDTKERDDFL